MSAPLPAVSSPAAPGAAAAASVGASGAVDGFEALLAALFGPAQTAGAGASTAGSVATSIFGKPLAACTLTGSDTPPADAGATDDAVGQGTTDPQGLAALAGVLIAPVLQPAPTDAAQDVPDQGSSPALPVQPDADTLLASPPADAALKGAQTSPLSTAALNLPAAGEPTAPAPPRLGKNLAELAKPPHVPVPATTPETPAESAAQPATKPAADVPDAPLAAAAAAVTSDKPQPGARTDRTDQGRRAHGDPASAPLPDQAKPPVAATTSPGASSATPNGVPFRLAAQAGPGAPADVDSADPTVRPSHDDGVPPSPPADAAAAPLASAHATGTAATPVRGGPETVAILAAQILKKLDGRSTRFDLELDPAGLGRVDVRLEVNAHGRLTAAMAFDNPQAAAELRGRANELTRALEQAGFDVAGGLSFDVAGDPGRSGRDGASNDQGETPTWRGRAFQAALDSAADADQAVGGALRMRRQLVAGVDIKI